MKILLGKLIMKKWKPNINQLKNNLMNKSKSTEGKKDYLLNIKIYGIL
jgi:hypothetical protein